MKKAVLHDYRANHQQKRCSTVGTDVSFEDVELDNYVPGNHIDSLENIVHQELVKKIQTGLSKIQNEIFSLKLEGYSLKEIASSIGISEAMCYYHFSKIKRIIAEVVVE